MIISTIILTIILMSSFNQARSEKITFNDLYSFPQFGDLRFSPDGRRIAVEVTTYDTSDDSSVDRIWTISIDDAKPHRITNGPTGEWRPRWSPDGKYLAFESDREGEVQIWLLPLDGGEAHPLTSLATGARGPEWAPGSDKIVFYSRVFPDCLSDSCNRSRLEEIDRNPISAKIFDHLLFRHYCFWNDGRTNRLFTVDTSGQITPVTDPDYDAPAALLGGNLDYGFSPDGQEICYVANTDSIPALGTNNDLFVIPSGGGKSKRITPEQGQDCNPRYSPDGRYIAYLEQARPGYESDQSDLVLYDRENGKKFNLTSEYDRSVGNFLWSPDGRFIYFQAIEHGFSMIWRIDTANRSIEKLLYDACYRGMDISPDGRFLAVGRSLSNKPYEIYLYEIDTGKLKQLSHFSDELTARVDMRPAEEFWFKGFMGDSVRGFLTLPPDFDSHIKYPLVLLIHGGPQWCWLGDFNYYGWNTQLMAAHGYAVAQIDPHGSVGYGQEFKEYVSGNWGKGDYEDLMIGVDYLLEKKPFLDSTRMAALGRSYGGFMTNWICGHTDRFQCLITVDGIFSQISSYFSADELWFPEWEFKGTPWTNRVEYERASPSTYLKNFSTPTMIIHGQMDYRVDVSEAFQMFTALQRRGIPSELLYFPDEGHAVGKIKNHRYVYEKQFEWLERWLK
nr:S9 family peptidase [candidate division Zixibacteria bacterium]